MISKNVILEKTLENVAEALGWFTPTETISVKEFYGYVHGVVNLANTLLKIDEEKGLNELNKMIKE